MLLKRGTSEKSGCPPPVTCIQGVGQASAYGIVSISVDKNLPLFLVSPPRTPQGNQRSAMYTRSSSDLYFSFCFVQVVVESGVCNRLVQLLDHPSSQVVKPALRTIGNVVCAEDDADYTEAILEAGSIVCLKKLIAHPNREIQKEVRP